MKLKGTFEIPRVNFHRFREALHERLSDAIARAAFEWIRATAEGTRAGGPMVPVWSGASRATFSPLASEIGYRLLISPAGNAPNRISMGIAAGTGTFTMEPAAGVYDFTYSTTLPHLIINEYYNANEFRDPETGEPYFHLRYPGPYHFQEAGQKAFRDYAAQVRLPGWDAILDVTRRKIG